MKNKFFVFLCCLAGVVFSCNVFAAEQATPPGVVHDEVTNNDVCDIGWYGNGVTCTRCPVGYSTSGTGATTQDQCVCDAGYFLDASNNKCTKCPVGTYKANVGNINACPDCEAGAYSSTKGATACTACPAGYCCAYGHMYLCKQGTYGGGGTKCKLIRNNILHTQESTCSESKGNQKDGGHGCLVYDYYYDNSVYERGVCETACVSGCTTLGKGATSSSDCKIKNVAKFCLNNDDNLCFEWSDSVSWETVSNNIPNNTVCGS